MDLDQYASEENIKKLPLLPETCPDEEKIRISGAPTPRLKEFKTKSVDTTRAYAALFKHEQNNGEAGLLVKPYDEKQSLTFPKMPSPDTIYMMMAGGVGGGLCGDELHRHMQRGHVTQNSVQSYTPSETLGKQGKITVRTFHSATITIIQANGLISRLTGDQTAEREAAEESAEE